MFWQSFKIFTWSGGILLLLGCLIQPIQAEPTSRDSGESKEEVPVPKIPEPLVFDMMRGLDAKAGELEINVLAGFPRNGRAEWAPEIEYAIADGIGIEFEVPFENSTREAWKYGLQFRLGHSAKSVHGIQLLGEQFISNETAINVLYLFGHRFNDRWSLMSMTGPQALLSRDQRTEWRGLQNLTVFYDHTDKITSGLEFNWAFSHSDLLSELTIIPQIHYELSDNWNIQTGIGVSRLQHDRWTPVYGVRVIWEL